MIPSCEPKKEKLHFSCILPGWTQLLRWRRRWDSNPRAPEGNCISSAARYDHFDTSPQIQTGKNRSENYLYNISFCSYKVNRKNGGILQRVFWTAGGPVLSDICQPPVICLSFVCHLSVICSSSDMFFWRMIFWVVVRAKSSFLTTTLRIRL